MTTQTVHIFSNGTEWDMWQEYNCARCAKFVYSDVIEECCAIEFSFSFGGDTPDGISQALADRAGYSEAGGFPWRCKEWQTKEG